ncbi:MAG TPA: MASE4 domain-containing protein [Acidimicrobiales bacterium]|nr:MASE4 domain-containing protein [Acidimicrobiales bacterium]
MHHFRPAVQPGGNERGGGASEPQRALSLGLVLVAVASLAALPVASVRLSAEPSFVPAMLALVCCFDLLSALFLLRQFLDTGDRLLLRLSWAYVFSLVVLTGYGASFPGVLGTSPPLALYPSTAPWLWVTWHTGFPVLLAAALGPTRRPSRRQVSPERRRRSAWASVTACVGAGALCVLVASVLGGHLPVVIHGDDTTAMTQVAGPVMFPVVGVATLLTWLGARTRTGPERWAAIAAGASLGDVVLTLTSRYRYSTGWYAGRTLTIAASAAVLVALLVEFSKVKTQLAQEGERVSAVMASVGEGVVTVDADGVVRSTNPAMERLAGRPRSELVGKGWAEALSLYDQRGNLITWPESLAAQAVRQHRVLATSGYGLYLASGDGQRVPVSMTAGPLLVGEDLLGAVAVLRDVSNEREVDQLKSSLVSTVSHELRTPLTMVQGFAELLLSRDDLGQERSREALERIHLSAQRLGRLIDDLLSVSRIDSGKLRVDLAAVDVLEVVNEAVQVAPSQAIEAEGHEVAACGRLVVDIAFDFPRVMADRDKFVQILTNLVSNALKYSPSPAPVRVTAERMHDHAEISVTDQGIGMSEAECSQVFEKFVRVDRAEVRRVSGTGLGLYITKSLVEMQHGQVWARSEPGHGSVFGFSLPLAPQAEGGVLAIHGLMADHGPSA